jgi:hypothetical protein
MHIWLLGAHAFTHETRERQSASFEHVMSRVQQLWLMQALHAAVPKISKPQLAASPPPLPPPPVPVPVIVPGNPQLTPESQSSSGGKLVAT